MKSNLLETGTTDRCATDGEIREAGAAQRIISLESSIEWSVGTSLEGADKTLTRDDVYCEMRAETGEWVQMYLFELEFMAALDESKDDEPQAN